MSDTLCRLASGGAFAVRQLYTDHDEVLFTAARPVILNGIEDMITRPDLADRAIMLTLGPITEAQRRPENVLWREFEIARPHILGALLDAAAHGLQALPGVRLERLPRMADFALWATACETARWPPVSFEAAYWNNRHSAVENVIDADPVAAWVRDLMAERTAWEGTASDLLQAGVEAHGNAIAGKTSAPVRWPRNPRALAGRLRRAQTFLRTLGIEIDFGREGRVGTRIIRMSAPDKFAPRDRQHRPQRQPSTARMSTARAGQRIRATVLTVGAKTTECGTGGRTRRTTSTGRCGPSTLQFCCSPGPEADAGEPPAVGTRLQATFSGQMGQDARTPNATPARRYAAGLIAIRPAGARRFFALTMPTQSNKILN